MTHRFCLPTGLVLMSGQRQVEATPRGWPLERGDPFEATFTPMHRWSLALIAGTVFLAACSSPTASTPTLTAELAPSSASSSAPVSMGATLVSDGIAPSIALTGNACIDWTAVHNRATVAITGTSDQLRRSMPVFLGDVARFRATVPAAQRADVQVFADAWSAIGRELERIEYDLTKLALDPATRTIVEGMGTIEVVGAMRRLDAWSSATCPSR